MDENQKSFYKKYYDDIKTIEEELVKEICDILQPVNCKSDAKLVEHMSSRIKTSDSTIIKLKKYDYEPTEENAIELLSDIIGVRLVVHFIGDVYVIRNILFNNENIKVIKEKDYIRNPKKSGYRGYHIIVERQLDELTVNAEIQIRTIAMDCWASLEHQMRYKKEVKNADLIDVELKKCSDDLMSADIAMEQILSLVKEDGKTHSADFLFEDAMSALFGKNKS